MYRYGGPVWGASESGFLGIKKPLLVLGQGFLGVLLGFGRSTPSGGGCIPLALPSLGGVPLILSPACPTGVTRGVVGRCGLLVERFWLGGFCAAEWWWCRLVVG
jgi:hypothetical protein